MATSREVKRIDGDYEDVSTRNFYWSGSDDFTGTTEDILEVVTRNGRRTYPTWTKAWTEVAPGISARKGEGAEHLRIQAGACPVRVRFLEVTRYISSDPEYGRRSASERMVTYVGRKTTVVDRLLFLVRRQRWACAAWLTRGRIT